MESSSNANTQSSCRSSEGNIGFFELDADKFWLLVLFAFDYVDSIFYNGHTMKLTPLEQLHLLVDKIKQVDESADISLKLKCGKVKVELSSCRALATLGKILNDYLEKLPPYGEEYAYLNKREKAEETIFAKDSPLIVYFAKMFFSFFGTQKQIKEKRKTATNPSKKEMDLVSQLIYFVGLSKSSSFNDIECDTLKAFMKQYKNYEYPNNISSIYPEFIC